MNIRLLAPLFLCGLLAACSMKIAKPDVSAYDLSAAPANAPTLPVRSIDVTSSTVLENNAMYYRLPDTTARNAFVQSRWSASPAVLIATRLKRGLPSSVSANSLCHLRLEMDDLVQVFSDTQHSQLTLEARASLFTAQGLLVRRTLNISQAAGADALSAITVSGALVQQLAQDLQAWTSQHCK